MFILLWTRALPPDWVLIDAEWGAGGPRRQADWFHCALGLEQSVELLANRKPETHNLQHGWHCNYAVICDGLWFNANWSTCLACPGSFCTWPLPQSWWLWGVYVCGRAQSPLPRKPVIRRGHFPLSLDGSWRAVVFSCHLRRNLWCYGATGIWLLRNES